MVQKAQPNSDASVGSWTDEGGATTLLYQSIDEGATTPNDADYVRSELSPSASPYVCGLETLEDPLSSSGHVIRWRRAKSAAGGETIDLTAVELRQGYVSEASQGTQIASTSDSGLSDTIGTTTLTLSGAEADAITDYADLALRFVADSTP